MKTLYEFIMKKEHCSADRRCDVQAEQISPTPSDRNSYQPDFMPKD
jgi:hypothetical protein